MSFFSQVPMRLTYNLNFFVRINYPLNIIGFRLATQTEYNVVEGIRPQKLIQYPFSVCS